MESAEEDSSLELNIFIWNVNYKRLEAILYLKIHALLYFKNVQPRICVIISHQAL